MREAFALQKLLTFFNKKYWHIWDISVWNFYNPLTNDVGSFEQLGPVVYDAFIFRNISHQILQEEILIPLSVKLNKVVSLLPLQGSLVYGIELCGR